MKEPTTRGDPSIATSAHRAGGAGDGVGRATERLSERLLAYLRERFEDDRIAYAAPPVRMRGGHDTLTCRFVLRNAPPGLEHPLVVRVYRRRYQADRVVREAVIMDALAGVPFPVPRVHAAEVEEPGLGGAFLVLRFCSGTPLSAAPPETIPDRLAAIHTALHGIDPGPAIESFRSRGWEASRYRFDLALDFERVTELARTHARFRLVVDWLAAHLPRESGCPVICHGDFHAANVLVRDGEVTGVLDWSDAFIADAEMDVARTMSLAPIVAVYFPVIADPFQEAKRYLECYGRRRAIDLERLDWYRVRHCLLALANAGGGWARWRDPRITAGFAAEIGRVSGIVVDPA